MRKKEHGLSCTAQRMDKFLKSKWGQRLFESKTPERLNKSINLQRKGSPEFLSTSRDNPLPYLLEKTSGPVEIPYLESKPFYSPSSKDIIPVINHMKTLKEGILKEQNSCELVNPTARRRNFKRLVQMQDKYDKLSKERLYKIKQDRVNHSFYPHGIVGYESYRALEKVKEKEKDSPLRIEFLDKYMSSSNQIYEGESLYSKYIKPIGHKILDKEFPKHYHNTNTTIFPKNPKATYSVRTEFLRGRWRREYDIITGTKLG